jgi:hypothetical protein
MALKQSFGKKPWNDPLLDRKKALLVRDPLGRKFIKSLAHQPTRSLMLCGQTTSTCAARSSRSMT